MAHLSNQHDSPMHYGFSGQEGFSPEELHELLGAMGDDEDHHATSATGTFETHVGGYVEGGTGTAAARKAVNNNDGDDNDEANDVNAASSTSEIPQIKPEAHVASGEEGTAAAPTSGGPDANNGDDGIPEVAKLHARSERKRCREKQRRSDVNKKFADLTQLLQRIDAEDSKETGEATRLTQFNPSNRVDLIARTIFLLERLNDSSKKHKVEIASLQQQLEEAKKAGEDTAAKLKEAMLGPPAPSTKQVMMMVPMMMSTDGAGATAAMPVMNPFMAGASMPMMHPMMMQPPAAQVPTQMQAPAPAAATVPPCQLAAQQPAPSQTPAPAPPAAAMPQMQQQQQQPAPMPFMMQAPMPGANFMMPHPSMGAAPGNPMVTMVPGGGQPMMAPQGMHHMAATAQSAQGSSSEEKNDSTGMGGSNLAHCA